MNALAIAQLAIALAPIAKDIIVEGGKVIATYKENPSQEDIAKALELSKSFSWPDLDFGAAK